MSVYLYTYIQRIHHVVVPCMCFSKIDLRDQAKSAFLITIKPFVQIPEEIMHS